MPVNLIPLTRFKTGNRIDDVSMLKDNLPKESLMPASLLLTQHGQHDTSGTPSSKRRKNAKKKRAASSRSPPPTAAASDSASASTSVGRSSGTPTTGSHRLGEFPEEGAKDRASEELAIDVIPTSSSKRCHSASVALRSTVDSEVSLRCSRWFLVLSVAHACTIDQALCVFHPSVQYRFSLVEVQRMKLVRSTVGYWRGFSV